MYDIDELYNSGKMPERYYNQLNGKTAQENYKRIKNKRNEGFFYSLIEGMLSSVVKTALDEIFDGFNSHK